MKTRTLVMALIGLHAAALCAAAGTATQELPEQLIVVTSRDRSVPVFPRPSFEPVILLPALDSQRVRQLFREPVPAPLGEFRDIPRDEEFPLPAEL
jgi:hypothetical protein